MGLFDIFSSKKTTNSSFAQQTDPWDETIPQLRQFLGNIKGMQAGGFAISPEQQELFDQLEAQLAAGNPNTSEIQNLATKLFATEGRGGQIDTALANFREQLAPIARGDNVTDFKNNSYINDMLRLVGDDISSRVNAQFAGAGRDLSGINQQAVARGVAQGTLPTLADLFSKEQARSDAARTALLTGELQGAAGADALDAGALGLNLQGIGASKEGVDAGTSGLTALLNLSQQQRELPTANAGQFLQLLGSVAGLGNQSSGTSKSTTQSSGFGLDVFGTAGKIGSALGFSLSDEREKEGIEEIGTLADGTPIYKFRYKDDPTGKVHTGPMAQDVEARNPGAVAEDASGRKFVNLDDATKKSAKIMKGY